MTTEILPDAATAARRAASHVAEVARAAVAARGIANLAFSGGQTPAAMLRALTLLDVPWHALHVFQVDERVAPPNSDARNVAQLENSLVMQGVLAAERLHTMPVEGPDLAAGASKYAKLLSELAGSPPVLDLVHLGLGEDGHTASLFADDPVLNVTDRDVAVSAEHSGYRRMTLTLPLLARARGVMWLVTGAAKARVLARMMRGDTSLPATRVPTERAILFADLAAAMPIEVRT